MAWRLRKQGLKGRTVSIKLVENWGTARSVSRTLDAPTDRERIVGSPAVDLLRTMAMAPDAVRLAGVRVANFDEVEVQDSLFDEVDVASDSSTAGVSPTTGETASQSDAADESKAAALDAIREKYGYGSIVSGASLRSNARH